MRVIVQFIAYVVLVLGLHAPVAAFEATATAITLNAFEAEVCLANGGCIPVPRAALAKAMRDVAQANFSAGYEQGAAAGFEAGLAAAEKRKVTGPRL